MSHLNITEMMLCLDNIFVSLFGRETFTKWKHLKSRVHFVSEADFVSWLLSYAISNLDGEKNPREGTSHKNFTLPSRKHNSLEDESLQFHMDNMTVVVNRDSHHLPSTTHPTSSHNEEVLAAAPRHTTPHETLETINYLPPWQSGELEDPGSLLVEQISQACEDVDLSLMDQQPIQVFSSMTQPSEEGAHPLEEQLKLNPGTVIRIHLPTPNEEVETMEREVASDEIDVENDSTPGPVVTTTQFNRLSPQMMQYKFRCSKCYALFKLDNDLKYHEKFMHEHSNETGDFVCRYCNKLFSTKGARNSHARTSHSNTMFVCELCEKTFGSLSNKHRHICVIHHHAKYECDICGNIYSDLSDRRRHMLRVHKTLKYQCKICNSTFGKLIHLTKHTQLGNCSASE